MGEHIKAVVGNTIGRRCDGSAVHDGYGFNFCQTGATILPELLDRHSYPTRLFIRA